MIIANPVRLLEIINENENLLNLNDISFLIVDEYIQFRKMQAMDNVKKVVELLKVSPNKLTKKAFFFNKMKVHSIYNQIFFFIFFVFRPIDKQQYLVGLVN